ncbi:MAG: hypothetical protein RI897_2374 [Verrucomicrobiota bacterium]
MLCGFPGWLFGQVIQGITGGFALRAFLAAPFAPTEGCALVVDDADEATVMVGAAGGFELVDRGFAAGGLEFFLKFALGIIQVREVGECAQVSLEVS